MGPLSKWGDAPRTAPAQPALSGGAGCFGRRSRSKHDSIFFPRLRAGKLCEACPTGRVGGAERWVGPFGSFYGLPPGPAGCALPGESVGRKGAGYPTGDFPPPQSLPLGGRTVRGTVRSGPGEATINHRWAGEAGSDEGAIWYPTFPCRNKKGGLPPVASTEFFSCSVGQPGRPLIRHLR